MISKKGPGLLKVYVHPLFEARLRRIKSARGKDEVLRAGDMTMMGLQREIRRRKKVEVALRRSERRQRHLVHQYMVWQENERKLLAQEIHDSIGGSLVTIKFALEEKLDSMPGAAPSETVSLEQILSLVQGMVADTRRLAAKLRPAVLDDLGLIYAIDSLCRHYAQFHNLHIVQHIEVTDSEIPDCAGIVIYRILQEAMANTARHSGARCLTVYLKRTKGIELSVSDDGCGFDPAAVAAEPGSLSGHGLRGMKDRALIAGGKLDVDSRPGNGTRIRLRMPDTPPGLLPEKEQM
jgi:two-component system, NarL family, sensor histidine kinase UhpB